MGFARKRRQPVEGEDALARRRAPEPESAPREPSDQILSQVEAQALRDPRLAPSPNLGRQATVLQALQKSRGNGYVQRLIEREEAPAATSHAEPAPAAAGNKTSQRLSAESATERFPLSEEIVHRIEAARASGEPLEPPLRAGMEAVYGADFGDVRVHADAPSQELARRLGARAFTTGKDIFVGAGASAQGSTEADRETLAHELAHVLQQREGSGTPGEVAAVDDPHEQAAERAAQAFSAGGGSAVLGRSERGIVHRIPDLDFLVIDTRSDEQRAREAQTPDDVKTIGSFAGVSQADRLRCIGILTRQTWIGPLDEYALQRLWSSFGDSLPSVAAANSGMWERSVSGGVELPIIDAIGRDFEEDVKQTAFNYMVSNRRFVREQMQRFGFPTQGGGGGPTMTAGGGAREMRAAGAGLGENDPILEVQQIARQVARADQAKTRMQQIPVGYNRLAPHPMVPVTRARVTFDPDLEPQIPPDGNETERMVPWREVKEQWDRVEAGISGLATRSPIVYAAIQEGRIDEIARAQTPAVARNVARGLLENLLRNIEETIPKIDSGDLDWRDLRPIHDQLYRRQGRRPWNQGFYQVVARDLLSDYESREFWISLGLGTLAAAAFIISELATGGLATALWFAGGMAMSAGQAVRSWENYEDLATAAGTAASEETRLVSTGQVSAAFITAILDTAFAFLDLAAPAVRAARAGLAAREIAQVGAERVGLEGLARLTEIGWDEASALIHRGINELGVAETIRRTGKNADQLLALAGRDSEAGRRIVSYQESLTRVGTEGAQAAAREAVSELPARLREIAAGRLAGEEADRLVVQAIEELGPRRALQEAGGWKHLARTLGNESAAGRHLRAWRDQVWTDLREYINGLERAATGEPQAVGIERTGRTTLFTNDMDMSLMGRNAATNLERARHFLGGRLGTDPDTARFLLDAGLFTDPRRLHLYDALPAAMRERLSRQAAAKEQELIYARRLHQARQWGDQELERQIRDQMGELGIPEMRWVELAEADRAALAQHVDALHGQLDEAIRANDLRRQEQFIREISDRQALINASSEGAYISGGGTRRFVTERDALLPSGWDPSMTPAQRLTAIVDQLGHLDEAARELVEAASAEQLESAIKGLGKYGERVGLVGGEALGDRPGREVFDRLANWFKDLKTRAESGAIRAEAAADADALLFEVRYSLSRLESASGEMLRRLRAEAGLEGVEGGMARIQRAAWAHAKYLRARDATYWQLVNFARGLRIAAQAPGGPLAPGGQGAPSGEGTAP